MAERKRRSTENRAFETLLRHDPELLRSLVDQAADALCLHEIDGRILDVNRRMCTTLGYSREELLSLTVFDIFRTAVDPTLGRTITERGASIVPPRSGGMGVSRGDPSYQNHVAVAAANDTFIVVWESLGQLTPGENDASSSAIRTPPIAGRVPSAPRRSSRTTRPNSGEDTVKISAQF